MQIIRKNVKYHQRIGKLDSKIFIIYLTTLLNNSSELYGWTDTKICGKLSLFCGVLNSNI